MKRKKTKNVLAGLIAVLLVLGMVVPLVASVFPGTGATVPGKTGNVAHLMEAGFPETQAEHMAEGLAQAGCGELTGIDVEDTGEHYQVLFYDDYGICWTVDVDYEGWPMSAFGTD